MLFVAAGLSYTETLLPILWRFLCDLGPGCGIKTFLELLSQTPNSTIHPIFSLLTLFCETASHLITLVFIFFGLVFKPAQHVLRNLGK